MNSQAIQSRCRRRNQFAAIVRHLSVIALVLLGALGIAAAPGDLDPTFSGDGKLTDFIPGQTWNYFAATVVQPDGKIIAVGNTSEPRFVYVARYNSDGSPDTTFGGTGKLAIQFGPFYNYVSDVALQPDGKIVLGGCYCEEDIGDYNLALARLNPNGSLDESFGLHGILTRPDIVGTANSIAIQPDGKIVVAGQAGFWLDWIVLRFNSDGSQDPTFVVSKNVLAPNHAAPYSVAIQTDGKVVAAGSSVYTTTAGDFALVRYNSDGSLDTTFDGDGIVITSVDPGRDQIYSIAIQTDGKLVAAGPTNWVGPDDDFAIVRYNSNGSLDTTFDDDGIVITPIGTGMDEASSVGIQHDGKIVAAGFSYNGSNNDFAFARYNTDGSLDAALGGDGKVKVDFDSSNDRASGLALDDAGRAVVVGRAGDRFAIARFLLGPRAAADFDGDGRADVSVYRPSTTTWYMQQSTAGFAAANWGQATDKIVPADYDGDSKTDIAVYRPSDGNWYVLQSSTGTLFAMNFGIAEDIPAPADFDSDGMADVTVFRPSTGAWWINRSMDGLISARFGTSGDKPVAADYNGDGRADLAVFRPSNGIWYWSSDLVDPAHNFTAIQFGLSDDLLTPADFDGDGRTDVAVYRPSTGTWYSLNSSNGAVVATQFGTAEDIPAAADFDGDGRADVSVFRPSDGIWYRLNSGNGSFFASHFGVNGDRPTPAAFRY